jgi:hypothetical protein
MAERRGLSFFTFDVVRMVITRFMKTPAAVFGFAATVVVAGRW